MLQVAIIGLGIFGIRMLEELNDIDAEIIILDKNEDIINKYKEFAKDAYVTDAINQKALEKCIPLDIDVAIVDVGGKLEVSIMTTMHLKKMGIKKIITKAESDEHGEVLQLVGAYQVIFPDLEAARRITPLLASDVLFNYTLVSEDLALAELGVLPAFVGKTLVESQIRSIYDLNVVAYRPKISAGFSFISTEDFRFAKENILLVAGTEKAIQKYAVKDAKALQRGKKNLLETLFK